MEGTGGLVRVALCLLVMGCARASCPWEEEGLLRWGDPATWDSGRVPEEHEEVVIPTDKRVLLDVSPPRLGSLTVEHGGALVWGDEDELTLASHFVMLRGELHVGSEDCRFTRRATIRLLGKTDSPYVVEEAGMGTKFVGVMEGGTLEVHGARKTGWTKLAQTVRPLHDLDCAFVYDHSDTQSNPVGLERSAKGAHVIVWNQDGGLMDFSVFKSDKGFADFFTTIPKGKVVGVFAVGSGGLGRSGRKFAAVLEKLGAYDIHNVGSGDSYSFLARIGDLDSASEFTKVKGNTDVAQHGFLSLHDPERKIVFQVSSSAAEREQFFRVLHEDAAFPVLTLVDPPLAWQAGDEVVVMSTDFDWRQAETRRIVACPDCSPRHIRVDKPFTNLHWGNFTQGVDERAEVAMLTRNVRIEGEMEAECYNNDKADKELCQRYGFDTFGGHLRVNLGHKAAHVRGVEVTRMGQLKRMGAYPLHFHMCDDVEGAYLRENSVHHTFSRCITIHGTDHLEVADNVCFHHYGHGLFVEDGVEQHNRIVGNLVAGTQHGNLLLSDMSRDRCKRDKDKQEWAKNCGDLSSYWITHPNNALLRNAAAGGDGNGFMYVFSDRPLGPSLQRQRQLNRTHHPRDSPMHFQFNAAHSNAHSGVFVDSKVSTGTGMENKGKVPENGVLQTENEYDPKDHGKPVWTDMSFGTYYKNADNDMWVKGGNIIVSYSAMADSPQGFSGGTTLFNSGTEVYRCLFVGQTDNKGMGQRRLVTLPADPGAKKAKKASKAVHQFDRSFPGLPTASVTGVSVYQGPVIVKDCHFRGFQDVSWCLGEAGEAADASACPAGRLLTRQAGAISFKRNNNYPSMTGSYVMNNTFGYCDGGPGRRWVFQGADGTGDWRWKDGNKMVFFFDKDGQLTGTRGAAVVYDHPLYGGPHCLARRHWGRLQVCPYRYIKLEVLGKAGNLDKPLANDWSLVIRRDDAPYDRPFSVQGAIRNEHLLQTHRSYMLEFNATRRAGAGFPASLKLNGYGVESGDAVRVGICQPLDVDGYDVTMDYPVTVRKDNATWVSSLRALDADTTGAAFFHDKANGILFFKLLSHDRHDNETQRCPRGRCWKAKIAVRGGTLAKLRSCAHVKVPPLTSTAVPATPRVPPCPDTQAAPQLGPYDPSHLGFLVHRQYSLSCLAPAAHAKTHASYVGCLKDKVKKGVEQDELRRGEVLELANSMTTALCTARCLQRGYRYAGLSRGRRCACAHAVRTDAAFQGVPARDCRLPCSGGDPASDRTCGGKRHWDVYTTA